MEHTYTVTGMTCSGCQSKVQKLLSAVPGVTDVNIDMEKSEASISMDRHVPTADLQHSLKDYPKYQLTEKHQPAAVNTFEDAETTKSWVQTYKPILIIFAYIAAISVISASASAFSWMLFMRVFMAGFFLVFSFFKMLDLNGFAESYQMYDVIARKLKGWGYVYAFTELALGLAYAINFNPIITNTVTLVVMTISIIGVLQTVLNKRAIRCACLGAVFNLPMSTVTIIEDGLMIVMSGVMLTQML